ncbi:MAG: hypothetical protein ABMA26_26355 [Limisphaerales bacterium]
MTLLHQLLDVQAIDQFIQSGSASWVLKAAAIGFILALLAMAFCFALAAHLFYCFCLKRICERVGHDPGLLVWFPILNIIPRLRAAKLPLWLLALYLLVLPIPFIFVYNWMMLCEARGKPAPLGLVVIVPLGFPVLVIYLAFAD